METEGSKLGRFVPALDPAPTRLHRPRGEVASHGLQLLQCQVAEPVTFPVFLHYIYTCIQIDLLSTYYVPGMVLEI